MSRCRIWVSWSAVRRTRTFSAVPIQPAGWVVGAVGVASLVGALVLHWRELLVLAVGCGLILVLSLLFVIGRSEIRLVRTLRNDRVSVGQPALVELRARNTGSVRTTRQVITEAFDSLPVPVPLPPLAPGAERTVSWRPPTDRRGRYPLGPARITKADPFRLMQREVGQTGVDELWVQPRVVPLPSFAGGMTKDIDGPTYDHSPSGDVAFHAVRPYRAGDDVRHVHWMATARAGEMMVRHYVDNRQPHVTIVVDSNENSWLSDREFDAAIDVVASIGFAMIDDGHPVTIRVGSRMVIAAGQRVAPRRLLDDLTLVETDAAFDLGASLGPLVASERNTTVAVVVTGSRQVADRLRSPVAQLGANTAVLLVQMVLGSNGSAGPGPHPDSVARAGSLASLGGRAVRHVEAGDVEAFGSALRQKVMR